jgi:hypothetical protein
MTALMRMTGTPRFSAAALICAFHCSTPAQSPPTIVTPPATGGAAESAGVGNAATKCSGPSFGGPPIAGAPESPDWELVILPGAVGPLVSRQPVKPVAFDGVKPGYAAKDPGLGAKPVMTFAGAPASGLANAPAIRDNDFPIAFDGRNIVPIVHPSAVRMPLLVVLIRGPYSEMRCGLPGDRAAATATANG